MNDSDWVVVNPRKWMYVVPDSSRWWRETAEIVITNASEWHLLINQNYVATFNSWAEARDATPMLLKLHGYESQS